MRGRASHWLARDSGRWRRAGFVVSAIVLLASIGVAAHAFDVHINWTDSMPVGLYQRVEAQLERGSRVVLCLEGDAAERALERHYVPRGSCPSGAQAILKRIAGVPGDRVGIDASGIAINRVGVAGSALREVDARGRALAPFAVREIELADGEYFVLGTNLERSWDSRYFGPVRGSQITGSAAPVWTF